MASVIQSARMVQPPVQTSNFKCVRCKKDSFRTAKALATHQEALDHHPFVCSKCNKEFATKNALKQHKTIHKNKVASSSPQKTTTTSPGAPRSSQAARISAIQQPQSPQPAAKRTPAVTSATTTIAVNTKTTQPARIRTAKQKQSIVREGAAYHTQAISHIDIPALVQSKNSVENSFSGPENGQQELHHKGHDFTVLSAVEQTLLFKYLLARCHPPSRLRAQKFRLPNDQVKARRNQKQQCIKPALFRESPQSSPTKRKRRAIVLDCEMVEVGGGQRELAFLTAVDFLTGEVLINKYVEPTAEVTCWNVQFSGVTPSAMARAVAQGEALRGWHAAREALWNFIDSQTVLVGHSLNADLDVLGMLHWRIVDSTILTGEAVYITEPTIPLRRLWGLKKLAQAFLDIVIQRGKNGHDCLEDTLATRDVVIWCLRNPEHLRVWAEISRAQDIREQEQLEAKGKEEEEEEEAEDAEKAKKAEKVEKEGEEKNEKRRKRKKKVDKAKESKSRQPLQVGQSTHFEVSDDDDFDTDISEILRWSDVAEDVGWPHPDTGYDPWSD